jgi:PKD repeat protein
MTTGTYTVTVNVTDATTGATSTSTRSIIYDPNPPAVTTVSASPVKVTTTGSGVIFAKDKNGPVIGSLTVANGVTTLDLTGIPYDPATLNIQALSAAGLSSRNGSFAGNAKPTIADALQALKISAKQEAAPPFGQMLSGDVAPLVNGESRPDGKIDDEDVVVILNKVLGLIP